VRRAAMRGWVWTFLVLRAAATEVTLYKLANDECGQATIDKDLEQLACNFAGFAPGNCSAERYTELAGTHNVSLPFLGSIQVSLYKKGDLLAAFKELSAEVAGQLVGLQDGGGAGKCCETCAAPLLKYYSLDASRGCSERCLRPEQAWLAAQFENLTLAERPAPCAALGLGRYQKTGAVGVPPLAISVDYYTRGAQRDMVILHRITSVECGQAFVDRKYEESLVRLAGFEEGTCYDQGYTVDQKLKVPFEADLKIALFKKPGHLSTVEMARLFLGSASKPTPAAAGDGLASLFV